jgi:hypothetical protein
MELVHPRDLPTAPILAARTGWRLALGATLVVACTVALPVAAARFHRPVLWLWVPFAALAASMLVGAARAAYRPSNWTLRADDANLYVHIRSFMNYRFTDERPSIVVVAWDEIASVRKTVEMVHGVDMHGARTTQRAVYLDVRLRNGNTRALRDALAAERIDMGPKHWGMQSRANDEPVLLPEPDLLRVVWNGETPPITRVLRSLAARVPVEADSNLDPVPDTDPDAQAVKLAGLGRRVEAIALLRRRHGYDLTEAQRRLDEALQTH